MNKNPSGTAVTNGQLISSQVDTIASAAQTLVNTAAANDFYLVVLSPTKNHLLNVEKVEVDSNLDVMRTRRWRASTYRKILP